MFFVSGYEEIGLGLYSTFKDVVVVILGRDHLNPLCGLDMMSNAADGIDPILGFLFG